MKRVLTYILCIALIMTYMPTMAFAQDEEAAGEVVYLDGNAADNGDGTKANPYNNFKAAMDGVAKGGTVELVNDYVKESVTSADGEQNLVQITKDITLELNQYKIYASGSGGSHGVLVKTGVTATIQNGDIICNKPSLGAVIVQGGGVANIVDCTVKAEKDKSAVYLNAGSTLIGSGTTFISAPTGYYGIYNEAKKIHLTDCTVDATGVTSSYHYGINVTSADMTFEECTVNMPEGMDAYELVVEDGNTATISGGEINGALRTGWKSNGTLKIEGNTCVNGQVKLVGSGTNNTASRIELAGGKYVLTENLISVNEMVKDNIIVSGGLFKNDTVVADYVKEPYKIIANTGADSTEYPYTIQNIPEGTVACVGNNTYTSLEDAMKAAGETETILLVANVETDTIFGNINGNGKTITYKGALSALANGEVTLTNANVKCADADISNIALSEGKLTAGIVNLGDVGELLAEDYFVADETKKIADVSAFEATIGKTGYAGIGSALSVAARSAEKETVILQKDRELGHDEFFPNANYTLDLNGHTMGAFIIAPMKDKPEFTPNNADITITDSSAEKTGKIVSEDNFAVATNGTLENVKLTLDGVTVESKTDAGIYFPCSGKLTVKKSSITGASGIEIRGGGLEIENSEITATATEFEENANSSGSTVTGAAIAVSQHTTNHDIKVEIKSGTFKGIKALYETDLQDGESDNIQIAVTGGDFDGQVESDNVESFIEGGTFTEWPGEELVADKTLAVQNGDNFHIGDEAGEIITDVQPGDKITILVAGGKDLVIPEGVIVENNTGENITINGEEVANGEEITTKEPEYIPPTPSVQKPTIEVDEHATVTLSAYGTIATIKVAEGYEIADVTVNGVSKGKVNMVYGLKTGDVLKVTTVKKGETEAEKNARLKAGVENTTIKLKSTLGKGYIKLNWTKSEGYKVDKYQVFRSTKRYSGYGTKAYFTTKQGGLKAWYKNTKELKKGTRYYYKVRGVREIADETVYTQWSNKAWRLVK